MLSLIVLITLTTFGRVDAEVSSIDIQPPELAVGDSVTVSVHGSWEDSCWSMEQSIWAWFVSDSLVVEIYSYDCEGRECDGCLQWIVPYEISFGFVAVRPGPYVVKATEYRDSLFNPGENWVVAEFDVGGGSPAIKWTWGEIKQVFR